MVTWRFAKKKMFSGSTTTWDMLGYFGYFWEMIFWWDINVHGGFQTWRYPHKWWFLLGKMPIYKWMTGGYSYFNLQIPISPFPQENGICWDKKRDISGCFLAILARPQVLELRHIAPSFRSAQPSWPTAAGPGPVDLVSIGFWTMQVFDTRHDHLSFGRTTNKRYLEQPQIIGIDNLLFLDYLSFEPFFGPI